VHISARADYAVRAMLVLANAHPRLLKAAEIAAEQEIPVTFLTTILMDLRRGGLVSSLRGNDGGYELARPAEAISVGDILRAIDGALTTVRGRPPGRAAYHGTASGLPDVWRALDTAITDVVDHVMLAQLVPQAA
jgi:Rrf2 family protein